MDVGEGNGVNPAEFLSISFSSRETIFDFGYLDFQSGNSRWFGGGVLGGVIEFVVVFDVSVGMIKLLMDGFELCVEAWDELAEFMSVVVSTCDICI